MQYDLIQSMKVEELKNYLKLRGLKVSGRKIELVARVFAASESNVPIVKTAVEVEEHLGKQYAEKLFIDGIQLPDPLKVETDWLDEDEGKISWPSVLYPWTFSIAVSVLPHRTWEY